MKKLLTILLATACFARCEDISVTGTLLRAQSGNESYIVVKPSTPVSATAPDGTKATAKTLQIAGLTPEKYQAAYKLIGKTVAVAGQEMFPETIHHHTPILIITQSVNLTK